MNQDISLNIDQRSIKISDFISARATEVSSFTNLLKNKLANLNKLPFQLLPKHMRRRAMSHNKYRIPTRVRERVKEEDLLLKKPSRCRHSLRKSRFLLSAYARRSHTARWLETHIWHAKRMKMKEYFGYNVAETCRAKSGRAAYKYFKTDSLLYDLSYNFIFEIKTATKQTTIQFLTPFVDTSSNEWKQFCNNKDIEKGGRKGYLTLWNNNPRKLIQRCEYIIRPTIGSNTEFQIWFLFHPSSKAGLELILRDPGVNFEGIKYKCYEANFNVFHLIGPRACNKVYWLLQNISNSKQEFERIENNPLIKAMKFIEDPGVYPRNFVLHISLEKRQNGKLLNAPKNIMNRQEQSSLDAQGQINEFTIELASYKYNPSSDAPSFDLWESPEVPRNDENSLRYKNITRGRYTHKKKNYLKTMEEERQKKAAKAKPKSGKKAKADENIEIENEGVQIEEEKIPEDLEAVVQPILEEKPEEEQVEPPVVESKKIEIIILHEEGDSQTCEGSGLKIIVPCGQGLYIWRYLNYLGCKALGMQEYHQVLNERRDFIFPQDFPSSKSYELFQENMKQEKITKYFKKPPAKRINLMKIGSPFAFASEWATLISKYIPNANLTEIPISEYITPAYVRMVRSRYPVNLATLCVPTLQDLERIKDSEKDPKAGLEIVTTEPLGKSDFTKPLKKVTSQEYIEKLVQVQTSRQLGGFITTGYLSYRFVAGCGKGYILKSLLDDLKPFEVPQNVFKDNFEISLSYSSVYYMLIKNPSSRFYYACKVYVLKP